jgi:hypothetical protein
MRKLLTIILLAFVGGCYGSEYNYNPSFQNDPLERQAQQWRQDEQNARNRREIENLSWELQQLKWQQEKREWKESHPESIIR